MENELVDGTLEAFVGATGERTTGTGGFTVETPRTLRVEVDGSVWIKPGAAIAWRGDIGFERLPTLSAGSFGNAVLREAAPIVRATGRGQLFCAHRGAHVQVVQLAGQSLVVAARDVLAFESSLSCKPRLLGGVGLAAGGMVVLQLSGQGAVAFTTHGRPLTLPVTPARPVRTDPHATVAWSSGLSPALRVDVGWRTAVGHGGQEPVQMHFEGHGFVVVQPIEEPGFVELGPHPLRQVAALVKG